MKKILIISSIMTGAFTVASSQPPSANDKNAKIMSVEEANKLNGTAQPTINGKPYSQYKAEQEALKQQEANKSVVQNKVPEQFKLPVNKTWEGKPLENISTDQKIPVEPQKGAQEGKPINTTDAFLTKEPVKIEPAKTEPTKTAIANQKSPTAPVNNPVATGAVNSNSTSGHPEVIVPVTQPKEKSDQAKEVQKGQQ